MFRSLFLALIAINANAVSISEESGMVTLDDVTNNASALLEPGTEATLPDGVEKAGDSIVDDLVRDFEIRQALRAERAEDRAARRAEREAILAKRNPDATTK